MLTQRKKRIRTLDHRRARLPDVVRYRLRHPERKILKIDGKCVYENEKLYEHARIARFYGFPELVKAQWPPYGTPLLIVGSGLSALEGLPEIKAAYEAGVPIMAIKGAHDWLVEQGVVPTYAVAADPLPERAKIFQKLNDTTIYLCASQMHPDAWMYMMGRKVIIWHSETDLSHRVEPEFANIPLVPGGSTTGIRALVLAYLIGFRDLRLYGFDSCTKEDREYKVNGGMLKDNDQIINVFVGEERFTVPISMVPQVENLMPTLKLIPGVKVRAYGQGYFQAVLNAGKAAGWPV